MEETIDLQIYLDVLRRRWIWIVGLALVAAIVGFVVSSLSPAVYEASAVVIVTQPRYQMQFDPRFETAQNRIPAYKAFPTLATSDGVLQEVVTLYVPSLEAQIEDWDISTLSGMVDATSEGDPSLVVLRVRSQSSQDSAAIANLWADVLVRQGNDIYGESEEDVVFFEEQVTLAEGALNEADTALIDFEARNQTSIVNATLEALRAAQDDYLATQHTIASTLQDIQGLREQLSEQPDNQSISLADSLTALFLQIEAFGIEESVPIQLQISSSETLLAKHPVEQIAFLDQLMTTLRAKSAEIDAQLAALEPQILSLQQKLQELTAESDLLSRTRDLAQETYLTLSRKLAEARIAAQEKGGILQIGSYAAVPIRPIGPRRLVSAVLAGGLGLMAGVILVVFLEIRDGSRPSATDHVPENDR